MSTTPRVCSTRRTEAGFVAHSDAQPVEPSAAEPSGCEPGDTVEPSRPSAPAASSTPALPAPGRRGFSARGGQPTPTNIDPASAFLRRPLPTTLPTLDASALGVAPPVWRDARGARLGLTEIAHSLRDDPDAIMRIAALISRESPPEGDGPIIPYVAYGSLERARPRIADAWMRGGECDAIMSIGAYLLRESGAADDVVVAQSFAYGGWHNVIIFRDRHSGEWKIMDYQNVVTVRGVTNREDALRAYFNDATGVTVMHEVRSPEERPVALYHMRSHYNAFVTGARYNPGLGRSMEGVYGTVRGLNDDPRATCMGAWDGRSHADASVGAHGVRTSFESAQGTRVEAEVRRPAGTATIDRGGVAVSARTGSRDGVGAKVLFHRDPGRGGASFVAAGEWWRIDGDNFVGIVVGAEARVEVLTRSGRPLSSVAPFVAASGGMTHTIVEDDAIDLAAFWNAHAGLTAPITLTARGRAMVEHASNGVSPDGWIEPGGFASGLQVGGNAGLRARLRLTDELSLRAQVAGRATITDPTLAPLSMYLPFRGALEGEAGIGYESETVNVELSGSGTVGSLFDRDSRWRAQAAGGVRILPELSVGGSAVVGEFVGGGDFADARLQAVWQPNRCLSVAASGGATVLSDEGAPASVVPAFGVDLSLSCF